MSVTVDFKPLTQTLSPLDATLTENRGRGASYCKPGIRKGFRKLNLQTVLSFA